MHKNNFDRKDPVEMMWVMSRKIVIINTDWVENTDRVAYYSPTIHGVENCDCLDWSRITKN